MANRSAPREFAVKQPAIDPRWTILLLVLLPELLVVVIVIALFRQHAPAVLQPSLFVHRMIALPIVLIIACLVPALFWAARRRSISLADGVLEVVATFYRRQWLSTDFKLAEARVVSLDEHREWRPFIKTNGFGMPGLSAGWFRSRKWVSLFCLITDRQRVLLLPLRTGGAVLLSAENPAALLDALRAADDGARLRS